MTIAIMTTMIAEETVITTIVDHSALVMKMIVTATANMMTKW